MKKFIRSISLLFALSINAQVALTDANFIDAINECLTTNPIDGKCTNSQYGEMPDWDVSNVTNMFSAFDGRTEFNANISNWNVSNVNDMGGMFYETSFNQDISNWNVGNVTYMNGMFSKSSFNQDISNWNVSNVIGMIQMFYNSPFNQDISNWDVSSVKYMGGMFEQSSFNQDIGGWDVSNVINMVTMFRDSPFNQDIGDWDVSSTENMTAMFYETTFNQDIGGWDVSNVWNMDYVFAFSSFNQDISNWNISNVTRMIGMFARSSFNQDIGGWDVSNVTELESVFSNSAMSVSNYDSVLNNWSSLNLNSNITFGAVGLNYCNGEDGRNKLINQFNWAISDSGKDCASLSIDVNAIDDLNIYPNPFSNFLFIKGVNKIKSYKIYTISGVLLDSGNFKKKIDIKRLSSGTYFIEINTIEGKRKVSKIIKK